MSQMDVTPKASKSKSVFPTPCSSVESSPYESTAGTYHKNLSASLKQRLKRCRRSFTSPLSVAKRLCVDNDGKEEGEEEGRPRCLTSCSRETVTDPPRGTPGVDANGAGLGSGGVTGPSPSPPPPLSHSTPPPPQSPSDLPQQLQQLRKEVKDKTETLRRLNMVKMYRSKNDLTQLQTLIEKWRSCSQAALCELQSSVCSDGRKASLSEVIDLCGLSDDILHFDRTEEDFTT